MTDVPLPAEGDNDWQDWATDEESMSDAAREVVSGRLTDANLPGTFTASAEISTITRLTQAEYDALPTKDAATLYVTGRIYRGGTLIFGRAASSAVDPANLWKGPQQVDSHLGRYPELQPIADQPQAKWVTEGTTAATVSGWAASAAGKTLLLSIYAIPGRDSGGYSAGGFPDRASYLSWLTDIRDALGAAPAIFVYEADALGLADGLAADAKAERIETLRQGVGILAALTTAETYIDASMWKPVAAQADLLRQVDVHRITGFCVNTSAYNAQATCYTYGNGVVNALAALATPIPGRRFVVDSSRNGKGPLTDADRPLADPWLKTSQGWCNPPKRRTGPAPGPISTQGACRATLWVKNPGESDGAFPKLTDSNYYGGSAPSAGSFWVPNARDLLGLHSPPGGGGATAGTVSDIKATFDADFGPFTSRSTGPTLVSGRARIPVNTGYENIATTAAYTLQGGTVYARLYAGVANGATSEASIIFAVNSPTQGDRVVVARIDRVASTIQFAAETAYFDSANVTITYDAVAHAYARVRESEGFLFWETSPDKTTWTQRKTAAKPAWVTATKNSSVQFVTHRNSGTADFAEVDNVNT